MKQRVVTIGALAKEVGIRASAIRYYEEIGLLPAAARKNGQRVYEESAAELLVVLHAGRQAGLTIADLQHLVRGFQHAPSAEWKRFAEEKLVALDAALLRVHGLQHVLRAALECTQLDLSECRRLFEAAALPR